MDNGEQQLQLIRNAQGDPALLALAAVDLTFPDASDAERTALRSALTPHGADDQALRIRANRGWPETGSVIARGTTSVFAGFRFPPEVISVAVRWCSPSELSGTCHAPTLFRQGTTQQCRRGHYEIATDVPARHRLRIAFHSLAATL